MNLSPKLAAKIAARYSGSIEVYGYSEREAAFREAIRRQGGIFAALSDDARRDFILTLGDNRRAAHCNRMRSQAKFSDMRAATDKIAAE